MTMWLCDLKLTHIKVVSLAVEGYCFLKDIFTFVPENDPNSMVVFKSKFLYYTRIVDPYKITAFFSNYNYNV